MIEENALSHKSSPSNSSGSAKAAVGRSPEKIRLRKLMKRNLKTKSIPNIELEDRMGNVYRFSDFYDYIQSLGCGGFGYVVKAVDLATGEYCAVKVCFLLYNTPDC